MFNLAFINTAAGIFYFQHIIISGNFSRNINASVILVVFNGIVNQVKNHGVDKASVAWLVLKVFGLL